MKFRKLSFYTLVYLQVFLFFSVNLGCLQANASSGKETDQLALLKFKQGITSDPNGIFNSWNDPLHFCNWTGITCGPRHQRVTSLVLDGENLVGSISPHIGNLSFLRLINLQNNTFNGEIPQQVGKFFRLQEFHLGNNSLQGEIPVNLTRCSQLKMIYLQWNNLTGKIPAELGSLTKLEIILLGTNNLTGEIPPSLGNLSSLTIFTAPSNKLEGSIPNEMGRLKGLNMFAVGGNRLSEYGMGGLASKEGDIYSYGILVLEMFSERRPTDEMFKEGLSLHDYVKEALPKRLLQIVDPTLLSGEIVNEEYKDDETVEAEESNHHENLSQVVANARQCLVSILEIGVACSMESPMERMNMANVIRKLHLIKENFSKYSDARSRPNGG